MQSRSRSQCCAAARQELLRLSIEAKARSDAAAMTIGGEVAAAYRAMAAAAHETLTPEGSAAFKVSACLYAT